MESLEKSEDTNLSISRQHHKNNIYRLLDWKHMIYIQSHSSPLLQEQQLWKHHIY